MRVTTLAITLVIGAVACSVVLTHFVPVNISTACTFKGRVPPESWACPCDGSKAARHQRVMSICLLLVIKTN